jgi:hypothetical protein
MDREKEEEVLDGTIKYAFCIMKLHQAPMIHSSSLPNWVVGNKTIDYHN